MIKKTENCLYCGEKMESITAKKKFCCDLHRVYWNREKSVVELAKGKVTEVSAERTEISFTKEQHQKAKEVVRNEIEQMIWEEEQKILNKKSK